MKNAVELALKSGYRHVDAAAVYDNEKEVGEGIKASSVPRKDIFVSRVLRPGLSSENNLGHSLITIGNTVDQQALEYPSQGRRR